MSPASSTTCAARPTCRLIVDWPSTAQANWLPTTKSTLSGQDQPLSKLLDSWLDPLQLGYRVIDSKTIQITSQPTLESRPDVEIYPLKGDTDQNTTQLIQDLKLHLGPSAVCRRRWEWRDCLRT